VTTTPLRSTPPATVSSRTVTLLGCRCAMRGAPAKRGFAAPQPMAATRRTARATAARSPSAIRRAARCASSSPPGKRPLASPGATGEAGPPAGVPFMDGAAAGNVTRERYQNPSQASPEQAGCNPRIPRSEGLPLMGEPRQTGESPGPWRLLNRTSRGRPAPRAAPRLARRRRDDKARAALLAARRRDDPGFSASRPTERHIRLVAVPGCSRLSLIIAMRSLREFAQPGSTAKIKRPGMVSRARRSYRARQNSAHRAIYAPRGRCSGAGGDGSIRPCISDHIICQGPSREL
jgi:hypothetical protein